MFEYLFVALAEAVHVRLIFDGERSYVARSLQA